jgi:hypothetical protein
VPYKEFIEVYNKGDNPLSNPKILVKLASGDFKGGTPLFDDNLFNDDNEAKKNLKELANVICRPINHPRLYIVG